MSELNWPKTLKGWGVLFWLIIYRCPVHKCRLRLRHGDHRSARMVAVRKLPGPIERQTHELDGGLDGIP